MIETLELEFIRNANATIADQQATYMRDQFEFYGIKSPLRREIQRPFLMNNFLPPKENLIYNTKIFWQKSQREFQYFSQELVYKYIKQLEISDLKLYEYMITHKSWWDTVDYIAPKLVGSYFKRFPNQRNENIENWIGSNNIWLQRSSILFQLKYKEATDTEFLAYVINSLLGTKEFFINKAIGWVLREYGKTNPEWVMDFVHKTSLSNLSRREALRLIK